MTPTVRPESPHDHAAIDEVVRRAFDSEIEVELVHRIRASPEYVPELALVAESEGRVVGHVMVSGATLRSAEGEHRIAMLSPLAVAPQWQRQGVGGALVAEATQRAGDMGEPFVVLEGSPTYYGRLGFEPAARYGITMPLPDWAPPEAAQLMRLPSFSREALHGGGAVAYPPAFDGVE